MFLIFIYIDIHVHTSKSFLKEYFMKLCFKETFLKILERYTYLVKFIYSEKATKFCEIFTLLLTGTT